MAEVSMTANQAKALARLTTKHPDAPLTLRQLRDRATILAEFGSQAMVIAPDKDPEPAA